MKQILLLLILAIFASCSPDEAPNPIQDDWKTLDGDSTPIKYEFFVDGQMCETIDDSNPYCGMRWEADGNSRYLIYRDGELDATWYVEFLGGYYVCRVDVFPAAKGSPASTFYMERL